MKKNKVPMIMQMEALECGAACLCMIAAYYKKWIPLSKTREDCGVSRDGSVAKNILSAAKSYGFKTGAYRVEIDDLKKIKLPAIIHWNFNHFVVLNDFDLRNGKFYINDPGKGRYTVSKKEFDSSFTGIVLTFEPESHFKPEGKPKSVIKFLLKYLKGSMTPFLISMLISLSLSLIILVNPIFDHIYIDNILSGGQIYWLNTFLIWTTFVLILNVLISIVKSVFWLKIEGKFNIVSSSKFMWHLLKMPLIFFSQRYIGDIVERQNATGKIALNFIQRISPVVIDFISVMFYLFFMIKYNIVLTLIGMSSTFLNIWLVSFTTKKMEALQQNAMGNDGKLASVTYSSIEMIETIKSTGAETGFFERWSGFYSKQNNSVNNIDKFTKIIGEVPKIINEVTKIVLQVSGIYLIIRGKFTIGMLMAFNGFLTGFFKPIDAFLETYQSFSNLRNEMEKIDDVFEYKQEDHPVVLSSENEDSKLFTGKLEIKNITFGYSRLAQPIIKNFNLKLDPGKSVALIGGSGSGKSTISKLIMGLYKPWEGEILFDGKKKEEIDPYRFYSNVSLVDQEKVMFNDTIKNNIKVWDKSIEDFSMILAAKDADIHQTIVTRKNGYDHVMREGGKDFSGGQCQRIEISRALATEPTLVILDEATSALDAKTENIVMQNIKNLGCSLLIIAHRLSTIRDCDEIIVLNSGVIVEQGTHKQLMESNNLYSKLVSTE
ncbi:MAG: NHLP family bacteriocin export ABC transporter peptidase/permease/ATPase subunit [Candidatus Improbicoccus pseudotrichonymphae]|uniref:NHLP family bacteriocin export ABC transporter peptidase/permease/ATPase subunit n=1 Tax=Candidatus Improbicoccus pseudotrichonymphae TaxID=3033792 RepID=A0AA48I2Q9_9FIRM|nr:MAG: NHLP family bacteriocin export ABC transporter peptidase/permease/ATPase subunit [Candidatus Improbicoccus pseudotrichonymphae]